jgi:hypothetical protein
MGSDKDWLVRHGENFGLTVVKVVKKTTNLFKVPETIADGFVQIYVNSKSKHAAAAEFAGTSKPFTQEGTMCWEQTNHSTRCVGSYTS